MANNTWLSLQRNEKALENEKLPYFKLSLPPVGEGGKWIEIGAAWKSKSGKPGQYSLKLKEGVTLSISPLADDYDKIND